MAKTKKINKEQLNKEVEKIVKEKGSIDDDIEEEGIETLDSILKRFIKENADTKEIDQDFFLESTRKYDLSDEDIDTIFQFFNANGYQLVNENSDDIEFDEASMNDMGDIDELDDFDDDIVERSDEELNIDVENLESFALNDVKI